MLNLLQGVNADGKQGTVEVETQLAHAIDQTEFDSRYDETAKKMLANKQVLAQIMKDCVNEYSDCTVDDIVEKYIRGNPRRLALLVFMSMIRTDPKSQQM